MKISVTMLSSYLYCSRKLFLEKVLMLEEPPKESVVMGSIRHETYDKINKSEEEIVVSITKKAPLDIIETIYKQKYLQILRKSIASNKKRLEEVNINMLDAYKKSFPFIIEESSTRAVNIFNFIEENNVFGVELWQKLTPKIISELRIESDELKLKGIIDQVHVYDNEYVPFELKTGRTPQDGVWPSHRIQIAAYSLLLQEKFNKPIKEGFVVYLDTKEKRHIAFNPYMKQEVKQIVNEIIELLESRELPDFCNNENKCRKCGLKQTCYNEEEVNNLLKIKISG
ncbi:CRISPR-associated protein Cas4 [Candidatus Woesearchaeota archaeon]|nr:CRISPR-associated protein Cas4 [Candidatus Woesearchaeota archaeon]